MSLDGDFAGPAMGFGYTVSGPLSIQGIWYFWSQLGYNVFCLTWILGIQFIDMS